MDETGLDLTAEEQRLRDARHGVEWRVWGPYLSERQWGTVREDYSETGEAWDYFGHDHARSRAYRWGEDGLAGISDDKQRLCFALALWNGRDPILKERLFGLTNSEGNHGEDVKEYYFYLDNLPTHSYQRWLYKYPQEPYPYDDLVSTNRTRSRQELEYELVDTGIFDERRYFDVTVEHAKAAPFDIACRITVANRGPEAAELHVLPTLWYRNTWSWPPNTVRPRVRRHPTIAGAVVAEHSDLGRYELHVERVGRTPSSSSARTRATPSGCGAWGVGGHDALPEGRDQRSRAVRHAHRQPGGLRVEVRCAPPRHRAGGRGGRAALPADAHRGSRLGPASVRGLRRAGRHPAGRGRRVLRRHHPARGGRGRASIMRQALAGMLWSKQCYYFDLDIWLREHEAHPLRSPRRRGTRNEAWFHMVNHDVISMPDKWEYPWYAAWDLAFHTIPLAMVDPDFAKGQLDLMLSQAYLHPTGQIPAYEWAFSDVNPPVHAFATLLMHSLEVGLAADGSDPEGIDREFLSDSFRKLLLNFTWWVNRKDPAGRNLFEGGFLGLDNVGVFDRSAPLPTGGRLEQADGTAWMALFSQNMLELACVLAEHDPTYEDLVLKFLERFFWIAAAIDPDRRPPRTRCGTRRTASSTTCCASPTAAGERMKVRSVVGLLPLCATTAIPPELLGQFPRLRRQVQRIPAPQPRPARQHRRSDRARRGRAPPALSRQRDKLRRILERMLDEERFLSPHGIRSISRWHLEHPYVLSVDGHEYRVDYEPAESTTGRLRRQLQLARADLVPDQPAHHPGAAAALRRTTATTSPSSARPARAS